MALHKTPTPETDANLAAWIYYDLYHCIESLMLGGSLSDDPLPWPDFACKLERERDEAREYADRLAEGLPDGMLPKDVEVLREANLGLATELAAVTEQRDRLAEALRKCREDSVCYQERMEVLGYVHAAKESKANSDRADEALQSLTNPNVTQ